MTTKRIFCLRGFGNHFFFFFRVTKFKLKFKLKLELRQIVFRLGSEKSKLTHFKMLTTLINFVWSLYLLKHFKIIHFCLNKTMSVNQHSNNIFSKINTKISETFFCFYNCKTIKIISETACCWASVNVARSGTIIFEKKIFELIGPNPNLGMKRNLFPGDRWKHDRFSNYNNFSFCKTKIFQLNYIFIFYNIFELFIQPNIHNSKIQFSGLLIFFCKYLLY